VTFKRGDRVRFTKEAEEFGVITGPAMGWVMASQQSPNNVCVRLDGKPIREGRYSATFLELVARVIRVKKFVA
jgi:hypothetical protein